MPIITATEYKTRRGLTGSDYDTVIGDIIDSKQAWAERYCGRAFDEATYTDEVYSGKGENRLYLGNWPVTAVSAVKSIDSSGTATALASTEYRLVGQRYLFRLSASEIGWEPYTASSGPLWAYGDGNYSVTYTAGYSTHPDDLKEAMYKMVDIGFGERGQSHLLAQSGDGVIQRVNMNPSDQMAYLANLWRPWKAVVV